MSALGLNSLVVGSTFGYPSSVVEGWMKGKPIPNCERTKWLKLHNLFYVQTHLPGFLGIMVCSPPDSKGRKDH